MAKNKSIYSGSKKISQIINVVQKVKTEDIERISKKSLDEAKNALLMTVSNKNFTQKHEYSLVNEIGLEKVSNSQYKIVAPISNDLEIKYEMYFAEYGAGVGSSSARSIRPRSGYVRTQSMGNATLKYGHSLKGYWYYPLLNKEWVEYKTDKLGRPRKKVHGRWGYTNTSTPANYMWTAREVARKEFRLLGEKIEQRIKTDIKRNW